MDAQRRLAVLIDADNTPPAIVDGLLDEIANYGVASVRRCYGDWTGTGLKGWKEVLLEHSIQPIQQFAYTKGKNATDSALIIDAMDLLYTDTFDGFCIVSSDSDFTRLAARLRESGLTVYGFGEKKTPMPFVQACDKFIYTEVLRAGGVAGGELRQLSTAKLKQDTRLVRLLRAAVEAAADDDGWAMLSPVGSTIAKQSPEFDARNYGFKRLSALVKATELFEIDERKLGDTNQLQIFVRDRRERDS